MRLFVGLVYLENPERDFNKQTLELMEYKSSLKLRLFFVGKEEKEDEELQKLILFSIFKPVDLIIIGFDFNVWKLAKFRDPAISFKELIDGVIAGKQEVYYY